MKMCSNKDCKRAGILLDDGQFYKASGKLYCRCKECRNSHTATYNATRKSLNLCPRAGCTNERPVGGALCEWHKAQRRQNRAKSPDRYRFLDRQKHMQLKLDAFNAYGGTRCACCGEESIEFLTIDHMNGNGNEHRRQIGGSGYKTYQWLRKNGYPTGFRVLCFNCNSARGAYGYCPHEKQALKLATVASFERG